MAYDNNYGFKTVKDNLDTSINGKWPIFGFDVNDIDNAFRTTRVVDSSSHNFPDTGNTKPNYNYGNNLKEGVIKELITSYDHGYDFRPMGYYTVGGTLNLKVKAQVDQTATGPAAGDAGGSYTVTNTYPSSSYGEETLIPKMNDFLSARGPSTSTYDNILYTTIGTANTNKLVVPPNFYFPWEYLGNNRAAWISVEIDDKKVYIYMNYAYYDSWSTRFAEGDPQDGNVDSRVRMVADTSGSTFNVNVFLAPYSIEEMLPDEQ